MHRSLIAAVLAALWLVFHAQTVAGPPAVDEATQKLARNDARGAVGVLEAALPTATGSDRALLLETLREAYREAIRQAEADGKTSEADDYRDNLEILSRKPRTTPAPAPKPAPASEPQAPEPLPAPVSPPEPVPAGSEATALEGPEPVPPLRDPDLMRANLPPNSSEGPAGDDVKLPSAARPDSTIEPVDPVEPGKPRNRPAPLSEPPKEPPPAQPEPPVETPPNADAEPPAAGAPPSNALPPLSDVRASVIAADKAFVEGKYDAAGKIYAGLAQAGTLPAQRQAHWGYCRAVDVVRRINARPNSPAEWASIDAEIRAIQKLSPNNWFAEYLRSLASERSRGASRAPSQSSRANKVVVRGSSDEVGDTALIEESVVRWNRKPISVQNFDVYYTGTDAAMAQQVASLAESTRTTQSKRWGNDAGSAAWSPRCEILLYSSPDEFVRDTGQPADSPGFTRFKIDQNTGRIEHRRIRLRADHPSLLKGVVPHEVTHVVLADLFPHRDIPRWADEGMAALSESLAEQSLRAAELDEPLRVGRIIRLNRLMAMDYPTPQDLGLFYAEAISLTRFLVESDSPATFLRFLHASQQSGLEAALRDLYDISDFADLETRWLAYARERTSADGAATAANDATVGGSRR